MKEILAIGGIVLGAIVAVKIFWWLMWFIWFFAI